MGSKVNHPDHYNVGDIETIDYLESLGIAEDFCLGNIIKYLSRYQHKENEMEDLEKAEWYLQRLIEIVGRELAEIEEEPQLTTTWTLSEGSPTFHTCLSETFDPAIDKCLGCETYREKAKERGEYAWQYSIPRIQIR